MLDYCVVKIPRLPFDKFLTAKRTLTTQMKATGEVTLGFASPKIFTIPEGLTVTVENDGLQVTIKGIDKQMVGEAAARIRSYYPAEPYKGKGIKYVGEHIRRKQGKKVA